MTGRPRRAMVLGAGGFVGAGVCAALRDDGFEVLAVSRAAAPQRLGGAPQRLGGAPRRPGGAPARHLALDLLGCAPAALADLLDRERPCVLVNATGAVWDCTEAQMQALNADLVDRLVAVLRERPDPPYLVQLGSVHEYGPQPNGVALSEDLPAQPSTPYGRTKLHGTRSVWRAARSGGLPAVVLRLTNVIGAGAPAVSLPGRIAGQLAHAARASVPARLELSPLRAMRDFVDVRDAAAAVCRAAALRPSGLVLNIGSGVAVPVREVVDRLVAISGIATHITESAPQDTTRSVELDWQQADVSRAARLLDWTAQYSLADSLRWLWDSVAPMMAGASADTRRVL